jgi:hypothetical protein
MRKAELDQISYEESLSRLILTKKYYGGR